MTNERIMNEVFIRELDEDIPLLTRRQLEFLKVFKSVIRNKILNDDTAWLQNDQVQISETFMKLSDINKRLKTILGGLREGQYARDKFLETYPKWNTVRTDGIKKLREIASIIQNDKFNCNVSRLVGYSTSLIGGGIMLASAILIPFTLGLITPLAIAGGSLTAAGCSTAIGTSVTEVVKLNTQIKKAKEIIEEDKRYFKEMNEWLEYSTKLDEILSEIQKIDVVKNIAESVKKLVEKWGKIDNIRNQMNLIVKCINEFFQFLPQNVSQAAVPIVEVAYSSWVLVKIFLLLSDTDNQLVFDCATITMRCISGFASLGDDVSDVTAIASLFTSNAVLTKDVAKAVTRSAVVIMGMAFDVLGIVLTSIDIHKGSLSKEAEKIMKSADDLEDEAKILQNVLKDIKQCKILERSLEYKIMECPSGNDFVDDLNDGAKIFENAFEEYPQSKELECSLENQMMKCPSEKEFKKLQKENKKNRTRKVRQDMKRNNKNKQQEKSTNAYDFPLKRKNPTIIIKNIPNEVKCKNILDVIVKENPDIIASENEWKECQILFTLKKFLYTRNLIVEVHPNIYKSILKKRRLNIAWNGCVADDFIVIHRCSKCLGYNHSAEYCKHSQACYFCAKEHNSKNCPEKNVKVCINCVRRNKKIKDERKRLNVNHLPFSKSCSCHNFMKKVIASKTNYG